jgi:hypothetical protein
MREETDMLDDNWIDTSQAAEVTGYGKVWLQELAREGKVTAQKLAGRWVFNKPNLLEYKHTMETLGRKKHGLWQEREASSAT